MKHFNQKFFKKISARRNIVVILTREILDNPEAEDFLIESEHQLCRRFFVSRVTVRLALSDLEHNGLIYRQHGRGTYAYGRLARIHRNFGILLRSPDALKQASIVEVIRGIQSIIVPLRASLVLISTSPSEWLPEMANSLGGVIVFQEETSEEESNMLKKLNLPFFCIQESPLTSGNSDFFQLGQSVVEALIRAILTAQISSRDDAP